ACFSFLFSYLFSLVTLTTKSGDLNRFDKKLWCIDHEIGRQSLCSNLFLMLLRFDDEDVEESYV
ncbi:hypothetical protein AT4G03157, partial [Arabidopsis thaliana]